MTANAKIAWEKWKGSRPKDNEDDAWTRNAFADTDDDDDDDDEELEPTSVRKMVMTPRGMVPLLSPISPEKNFNLWIGHTNFKLTAALTKIISKVPGVESLDIYTPYRMRMGVGKMFIPQNVAMSIGVVVKKHLERIR